MKDIYVLQYDDDPYCAPYAERIYENKEKAFEYAKQEALKINHNFRCIDVWEFNNEYWDYEKSTSYYYDEDKNSWVTYEEYVGE